MTGRETRQLLEKSTGITWSKAEWGWLRDVEQWADCESTLVVFARRPWRWLTLHCIALQQGCVYDPNYSRSIFSSEYENRHWRVAAVFRPADAKRLIAVRQFYLNAQRGPGRNNATC
jgi:hypothetical protein